MSIWFLHSSTLYYVCFIVHLFIVRAYSFFHQSSPHILMKSVSVNSVTSRALSWKRSFNFSIRWKIADRQEIESLAQVKIKSVKARLAKSATQMERRMFLFNLTDSRFDSLVDKTRNEEDGERVIHSVFWPIVF